MITKMLFCFKKENFNLICHIYISLPEHKFIQEHLIKRALEKYHCFPKVISIITEIDGSLSFSDNYDLNIPFLEGPLSLRKSASILQHIIETHPDIVIFPLMGGEAFFSMQMKKFNLSFKNTHLEIYETERLFEKRQKEGQMISSLPDLLSASLEYQVKLIQNEINLLNNSCSQKLNSVISIGVAIVHYNRPNLLERALDSLSNQTRIPEKVIVIDNGSDLQIYNNKLDDICCREWPFEFILKKVPAMQVSSARNLSWKLLDTTHVMFMDDDNIAYQNELEIFEYVYNNNNVDILTCHMDYIKDDDTNFKPIGRWVPLGGFLAVGLVVNLIGDTNFFSSKQTLMEIQGFSEDGHGYEDWELFVRAMLHGKRIDVIPCALFMYTRSKSGRLNKSDNINSVASIANAAVNINPDLYPLIQYARGNFFKNENQGFITADMWCSGRGRK